MLNKKKECKVILFLFLFLFLFFILFPFHSLRSCVNVSLKQPTVLWTLKKKYSQATCKMTCLISFVDIDVLCCLTSTYEFINGMSKSSQSFYKRNFNSTCAVSVLFKQVSKWRCILSIICGRVGGGNLTQRHTHFYLSDHIYTKAFKY